MKKLILSLICFATLVPAGKSQERFGNTLNMGIGVGYYGPSSAPAFHLNYEFDVFKNVTLAPFVTVQSRKTYYYGYDSKHGNYHNYYYRETYIPIGVKGSYYFDELFEAGERWDFYAAASLGIALRSTRWIDNYEDESVITYPSPFYGSLHIGSELHLNQKVGLFLDLSTGLSTFGLAVHL